MRLALPPTSLRQRTFDNGLIVAIDSNLLAEHTGGDVWMSSFALQRYLSANQHLVADKRVLDVGAGTAYLAMSVQLLGATYVAAADRGGALQLAQKNIIANEALLYRKNDGGRVECVALDWDEVVRTGVLPASLQEEHNRQGEQAHSGPAFDLVLVCDCIYEDREQADGLLAVLTRLCESGSIASAVPVVSWIERVGGRLV